MEWISVEDRLPDNPGKYLVAYRGRNSRSGEPQGELHVGLDSFRGKTAWAKYAYSTVYYWMPMPEPPVCS